MKPFILSDLWNNIVHEGILVSWNLHSKFTAIFIHTYIHIYIYIYIYSSTDINHGVRQWHIQYTCRRRDKAACLAMDWKLEKDIFLTASSSRSPLGLNSGHLRATSPRLKRPVLKLINDLHPVTRLKDLWSYTSTPPTSSAHMLN
jgi:hypothetical protein